MKFLKLTIRSRLSLLFALSAVIILVGLSCFIYFFTLDYRRNEFRDRLKSRLLEADSLLRQNKAYPFMTLDKLPPGTLPKEKFYYRLPATIVSVVENSDTIALASLADAEKERFIYSERNNRAYLIHFDKSLGHVIVLSAEDVFGYTKMQNLKQVLLIGIVLGTIALGFVSWYLPLRELQPLADKIAKARRIGGENLSLRLNVRNDYDEMGQLAITFNQMLDRIEKAFAVQKQFTSNAAHELRNPITAISGEAQLALLHPRTTAEYTYSLTQIKAKADELEKLVERLLILAKTGTSGVGKTEVRLDEILLEAVSSVQTRQQGQPNLMTLQINEADGDAYLMKGDASMLQLAIANILENALKYGEGKLVKILLIADKEAIRLQVTDEGIGVAEEDSGKLFELFYRHHAVRHIQGTGIGLTLVKNIVEWHNGIIKVQANQPRGTTVVMSFPGLDAGKS